MNIKHAVTAAASVAVTAATVTHLIRNRKSADSEPTIHPIIEEAGLVNELRAFCRAQVEMSRRTEDGYYDDKTDAEYFLDFDNLYANYLTKA